MKVLIVYDSQYGNTEQVAKAIAGAFTQPHTARVAKVGEAKAGEAGGYDLLIIGSPTQGGRATTATQAYVNKLNADSLQNTKVATFDTRIKTALVKVFGFAAGRLQKALEENGIKPVVPGEGFFVDKTKGPVRAGELERAAAWGKKLGEGK